MNRKIIAVTGFSLLFTWLFYDHAPGLNLFVAEIALLIYLVFYKELNLKTLNQSIVVAGFVLTSIFTLLTHSVFSYLMNFASLMLLSGLLVYPELRSLLSVSGTAVSNGVFAQFEFLAELGRTKNGRSKWVFQLRRAVIFIIPVFVIIFFMVMYSESNPKFSELFEGFLRFIEKPINWFFKNVNINLLLIFLFSLFFSNLLIIRSKSDNILQFDVQSTDYLKRFRRKNLIPFRMLSLKRELLAATFLLLVLNGIILILNCIDIYWVWFNFEWQGQYLQQFVHEGTYLLIFTILISIAIVLYFFNANLNYYAKNKFLKGLAFAWIAQNAILTLSVAIRNFYYIQYFSLAYKRIGVLLFLLMVIYGLYTVFVKVREQKTSFYLIRRNFLFIFIVLVSSSLINWDAVIARYNFNHSKTSFVHLDFLSTLSDKTLPLLDHSLEELKAIQTIQDENFDFRERFMSPESYVKTIGKRKLEFIDRWESQTFWSWNLPEYQAYKKIKKTITPASE